MGMPIEVGRVNTMTKDLQESHGDEKSKNSSPIKSKSKGTRNRKKQEGSNEQVRAKDEFEATSAIKPSEESLLIGMPTDSMLLPPSSEFSQLSLPIPTELMGDQTMDAFSLLHS